MNTSASLAVSLFSPAESLKLALTDPRRCHAICHAINYHGAGSHPWADAYTVENFAVDYVGRCLRDFLLAPETTDEEQRNVARELLDMIAPLPKPIATPHVLVLHGSDPSCAIGPFPTAAAARECGREILRSSGGAERFDVLPLTLHDVAR